MNAFQKNDTLGFTSSEGQSLISLFFHRGDDLFICQHGFVVLNGHLEIVVLLYFLSS